MKTHAAHIVGPPHAAAGDEVATKAKLQASAAKKVDEFHNTGQHVVLNE